MTEEANKLIIPEGTSVTPLYARFSFYITQNYLPYGQKTVYYEKLVIKLNMPMLGQLINQAICCPRRQNDGMNSWVDRLKNKEMADIISTRVNKYSLI